MKNILHKEIAFVFLCTTTLALSLFVFMTTVHADTNTNINTNSNYNYNYNYNGSYNNGYFSTSSKFQFNQKINQKNWNNWSITSYGTNKANNEPEYSKNDGNLFETVFNGGNVEGSGGVWFGQDGKDMNYWLSVWSGNKNITGAHIHCGGPNQNGPVVVTLFNDTGKKTNGEIARGYVSSNGIQPTAKDCAQVIGYQINTISDLAKAIMQGNAYMNVHTTDYPNGIARGQLMLAYSSSTNNNYKNNNFYNSNPGINMYSNNWMMQNMHVYSSAGNNGAYARAGNSQSYAGPQGAWAQAGSSGNNWWSSWMPH